jgi:hypothetical protein
VAIPPAANFQPKPKSKGSGRSLNCRSGSGKTAAQAPSLKVDTRLAEQSSTFFKKCCSVVVPNRLTSFVWAAISLHLQQAPRLPLFEETSGLQLSR